MYLFYLIHIEKDDVSVLKVIERGGKIVYGSRYYFGFENFPVQGIHDDTLLIMYFYFLAKPLLR